MAQSEQRPLIVRRVVKRVEAHRGGAWKVAYADFVTAMMAIFLLMWLLNATSEDQREGIADYFEPTLPISLNSAGGAGLLSGDTIFSMGRLAGTEERGTKPRPGEQTVPAPEGTDPAAPIRGSEADLAERTPTDAAEEENLYRKLQEALDEGSDPTTREHFRLRVTPEGLVIEIVDLTNQPLFEAGSAQPGQLLDLLLGVLAPLLQPTLNPIAIVGHTDARPYLGRGPYSNWELSVDRANAARRLLQGHGLDPERIVRVSGVAATEPLERDPLSPLNRRIAIVLLRKGQR